MVNLENLVRVLAALEAVERLSLWHLWKSPFRQIRSELRRQAAECYTDPQGRTSGGDPTLDE